MPEQGEHRLWCRRLAERGRRSAAYPGVAVAQRAAERGHGARARTFAERNGRGQAQAPFAVTQPRNEPLAERRQTKTQAGIQRGQPHAEIGVVERGAGQACAAALGQVTQGLRGAPAHVHVLAVQITFDALDGARPKRSPHR